MKKITQKINLLLICIININIIYFIYNLLLLEGIEDILRYITSIIIFIIGIILSIIIFKTKNKKIYTITVFISLLLFFILLMGSFYINRAYNSINKINKTEALYSTNLIALKESKINDIKDLKNKKIGIIKDKDSIEGYIISQEIINDNKINSDNLIEYDDFVSMLYDLYDKELDALFISGNYTSMFSTITQFENIKNDTIIITSKTKKIAKEKKISNNKAEKITKPFTMLIMGIDSTAEDIKTTTSFNGDSLILVTFNPKTLNATMVSIPRDTFVPIMCFKNNIQNKITHAAWYGESCMIKTIENFTNIDIDYYLKINFKGVVKLVNALGGVTVEVPYSFCEQDSNRYWGKNTVYVEKGLQTLNGEQALALARNRHPNPSMCSKKWTNYQSDDFVRGQNQQLVIKSLLNKIKDVRDINKLYEILDLLEKSMDTNLTTNQLLSFYNVGKSIIEKTNNNSDIINFEKLYLMTYGKYIYDEGMRAELSNQIYYKGSLDDILRSMKINLELEQPTIIKTFNFSIKEPYEVPVIGKGSYKETTIPLVPDFTKHNKTYATNWGEDNNINIEFKTIESSLYADGQIINQSVPKNSLVSLTKTITLTTVIKKTVIAEKIDCTKEEDKDSNLCIIPNFKDKNISDLTSWLNKITSSSISVTKIAEKTDKEEDNNIIYYQTESVIGKNIYDLKNRSMTIEYYEYEEDDPINPLLPN